MVNGAGLSGGYWVALGPDGALGFGAAPGGMCSKGGDWIAAHGVAMERGDGISGRNGGGVCHAAVTGVCACMV